MKNRKIPFVEYYLKKYSKSNYIIIDVGCGSSQYRYSTSAKYFGIDLTKDSYSESVLRDVDVVASAESMPFRKNSVDLFFFVGAFYQIPNYNKVLFEVFSSLKPGGRVLLFDYNSKTQKKLEINENRKLPCWSQNKLKRIISEAGFINSIILPRGVSGLNILIKHLWFLYQDLFASWIIVTGVKR